MAFIDILGFQELIRQSTQPPRDRPKAASLHDIYEAMSLQFDGFADLYDQRVQPAKEPHDIRATRFSDFVALSCPANERGLDLLCFVVWCVAREWLSKGYLSRGGISKGQVIHEQGNDQRPGLIFGPAFIAAFNLEQEIADVPRVVVSREVRKDVEAFRINAEAQTYAVEKLLVFCDDGPMSIDLFAHLKADGFVFLGSNHQTEAKQFADALRDHLDHWSDTPRWHRKTTWLIEHFNKAVETKYSALKIKRTDF